MLPFFTFPQQLNYSSTLSFFKTLTPSCHNFTTSPCCPFLLFLDTPPSYPFSLFPNIYSIHYSNLPSWKVFFLSLKIFIDSQPCLASSMPTSFRLGLPLLCQFLNLAFFCHARRQATPMSCRPCLPLHY